MSKKFKILIFVGIIFISLPFFVSADTVGQRTNFFIDQSFDTKGRERILAVLEKVSLKGYFYLESDWYETLSEDEKKIVNQNLEILGQEFDNTIYPKLTAAYGAPWEPGIDNSYNVTILFHKMKDGAAGYFNDGDEYPRLQNQKSNEREMVYLNADYLKFALVKSYLAHEFIHLITFNQKDKERGSREEVWLNEARAEFAPTLLGYDTELQGSNLQQRVNQFVNSPSDSLTEWQAEKKDYGITNIFIQYLADNYGSRILTDSLKSKKTGIESINEALNKAGFKKNFSQIFTDWTIAVFLADCGSGSNYCYKNENLRNLKVAPSLIFLPSTQRTSIFLDYSIKQWSGNWYRIIGGKGDLTLDFDGEDSVDFKVGYVLCSSSCQVKFLELDGQKKGKLSLENFGKNWSSLNLIPSIQSKVSGFSEQEPLYPFSISASIKIKTEQESLIEELTAKIAELQAQIVQLRAAAIPDNFSFEKNLFLGMTDPDVAHLKIVLDKEIFHQPWSGNEYFGKSALAAVKLFQEKYKNEISQFSGYQIQASGLVGKGTRAKLNQLLKNF